MRHLSPIVFLFFGKEKKLRMFGRSCKEKKSGELRKGVREGTEKVSTVNNDGVMSAKLRAIEIEIAQRVLDLTDEAYKNGCSFIVIEFSPNGLSQVSSFSLDEDDELRAGRVLVDILNLASRVLDWAKIYAIRRPKSVGFRNTEIAAAVNLVDHMVAVNCALREAMLGVSPTSQTSRPSILRRIKHVFGFSKR